MNALTTDIAAGTNTPLYDLNQDGDVNQLDLNDWLSQAGEVNLGPGKAYLPGDADLSGGVDGSDFGAWNRTSSRASPSGARATSTRTVPSMARTSVSGTPISSSRRTAAAWFQSPPSPHGCWSSVSPSCDASSPVRPVTEHGRRPSSQDTNSIRQLTSAPLRQGTDGATSDSLILRAVTL